MHRPSEPSADEVQRIRELYIEHMKPVLQVLDRHSKTLQERIAYSWLDEELPKWAHLYLSSVPQIRKLGAIESASGLDKHRAHARQLGVVMIPSSDEDDGTEDDGDEADNDDDGAAGAAALPPNIAGRHPVPRFQEKARAFSSTKANGDRKNRAAGIDQTKRS